MGKLKLTTIHIDCATLRVELPGGYRRVVSGYTRQGDVHYVPDLRAWVSTEAMDLVGNYLAVARPKEST